MVSAFVFFPALYTLFLSLTDASLLRLKWDFVGLSNYIRLFADPDFTQILKNTYTYVFITIFFQFTLGLGFALALNSVRRGRAIYGAIIFLPWVLSDVIAVASWKWIFNDTYGLLNYYLGELGLGHPKWLSTPQLAMAAAIVLNIWKGTPFSTVLELAGLQTIPHEMIESAKVYGASRWQIFRYVTLPMMRTIMLVNIVLITIYTFNIFGLVYAFTGGGPLNYTEIIGLFMYRQGFELGRIGYGASVAVVMFLLNVIIALVYIRIITRGRAAEELL